MSETNTGKVHIVVMAKAPLPGRVKTRLIGGEMSAQQAAMVHAAMLKCVVNRLSRVGDIWPDRQVQCLLSLADTRDPSQLDFELPDGWIIMDQGSGDLGQRLTYVWEQIGSGRCVFFGSDSPDLPYSHIAAVDLGLREADAVVGPVDDGGYWTLGANRLFPPLLQGIDWGTASVYHQTRMAADAAGIALHDLPPWYDVDELPDLAALRKRLNGSEERALQRLAQDLNDILEGSPS